MGVTIALQRVLGAYDPLCSPPCALKVQGSSAPLASVRLRIPKSQKRCDFQLPDKQFGHFEPCRGSVQSCAASVSLRKVSGGEGSATSPYLWRLF